MPSKAVIHWTGGLRLSSSTGLSEADTAGTASDGAVLNDANAMKRFEEIGAGDGILTYNYDEAGRARRAF